MSNLIVRIKVLLKRGRNLVECALKHVILKFSGQSQDFPLWKEPFEL